MDDLSLDSSGGGDAPAFSPPDVGDSSTPSFDQGGPDLGNEAANYPVDVDFDKIFGLEPEQVPETPDVPEATVSPDPRQIEEPAPVEEPKPETPEPAKEPAPEPKEPKETQSAADDGKLNWESAPEHFRSQYKELKDEYLKLATQGNLETDFISQPEKFRDWMKEASPTSYQQVGQMLVTESVEAHPEKWAQYLLEQQPDLVAKAVSGRENMTLDRLKAELSILMDDDDPDVQAALAKQEKPQEAVAETPEQAKIRQIIEREEIREYTEARQEVTQPIVSDVNNLVSQAGLEVDLDAVQGKDFAALDEDTRFKVFVNTMMPVWIDQRISENAQIAAMQSRMEYFLSNKDEKGQPKAVDKASAQKLLHPMKVAVSNFANEFLAVATGQQVKGKQKETAAPNPTPPPPQVRSAGASTNGAVPLPKGGNLDWSGDPNKW